MNQPLLDHASETMRQGSKSFAAASRLFDPHTRRSALLLYTWCRHCDDVIDGQVLGHDGLPPPPGEALARLEQLRETTAAAYRGEPMSDPAFAAFQAVAHEHGIEDRHAFAHLDGFAMDVEGRRYETLEDTLEYCYHVAGVVGLMMARVMGVTSPAVLQRACDLGLAFQLTNIARDIVEDAGAGRCYLPHAWLRELNIPEADLAAPTYRPALAMLASRLVEAAEPYYASAVAGIGALPPRCAWAVATALEVYRAIGLKVRAAGPNAWDKRQGTSKGEKLMLLGKATYIAGRARFTQHPPRPPGLWAAPI
ncbi:phytoene/squalene synthase family protein [Pseudomonas sp. Marseille-Q5115]|uniref:phytoene/squalene synthase family protein n=1 Tax=Pseudomonas sp. Marseille-Q5115 TaxID=2866593 RepID=UPI001CE3FC87|nr:phytoene/squalene synthase family protein [Pseudomonas sp. Marseille-Q5115]